MKRGSLTAMATLLFFTAAGTSSAHQIWIQQDDSGASTLHYGEFHENLREVSPGLLDSIEPKVRLLTKAGEQSIIPSKQHDAFKLSLAAKVGESLIAENNTPIFSEARVQDRPIKIAYFSIARYVPDLTERAPTTTLDIVPASAQGRFSLSFRGVPLRKAKISIRAESGWIYEAHSDDAGNVEAKFPWKGPYVLEVMHTDRNAGTHGDKPFDVGIFTATLSFVQAEGLAPLPVPPPQAPSPAK